MNKQKLFAELDDIHFKYERLVSLISILQMFVSDCVDIKGTPENSISNVLYEIELEMDRTNKGLADLIKKVGGAVC